VLNPLWLKSFSALYRHRSFQAAAKQLCIAQPTLSQHIMKLEEQLDTLLFRRGKSGCDPTRAALALHPYAQSLLRLNERARAAVRETGLRIGASSNIGIYMLQPYLRSFQDVHSQRDLDVTISANPAIAEQLTNGELDIAVMEWWQPTPGFRARQWRQEPVVLIVPPGHPCAGLPDIDRQTLAGMTLLGGEPGTGTGRILAGFFGESGPFPSVSLELGSTEAVKQAVKSRLGVSLVMASSVREEVRAGSLVAIPVSGPGLVKELMVICPEAAASHPPVSTFVSHLCQ
jgi:DNA-binding transcriptional LysR family regulator